jgi:hypothetical protein
MVKRQFYGLAREDGMAGAMSRPPLMVKRQFYGLAREDGMAGAMSRPPLMVIMAQAKPSR